MKAKFFLIILLGAWINFNALASGQLPVSPARPVVAPAKVPAVKNPVINGNRPNHGWGPISVGGPAKATQGTGAVTGTAGAHKH
jgi:hypothetical protein